MVVLAHTAPIGHVLGVDEPARQKLPVPQTIWVPTLDPAGQKKPGKHDAMGDDSPVVLQNDPGVHADCAERPSSGQIAPTPQVVAALSPLT